MEILPLYSQNNPFNSDRIYPSIRSPCIESPSHASIFRTVPTHNMSNSACHANGTLIFQMTNKEFLSYIHINMVITILSVCYYTECQTSNVLVNKANLVHNFF